MFRFTIRDLLWLMVVVGLACGWFLNDRAWRRYRDYRVAFAEQEAHRLMLGNAEASREIDRLLRKYGETEKLMERTRKAMSDPKVNRDIPVPMLVP
ncbi:MAG TPA: hypothetical protein VGI40_26130 [Pirellulaceae bacterium]|jgi:hypothetical protein